MPITMNQLIRGFFWFAFAAFLAASIPHVAYFFRAFEPSGSGLEPYWWAVAYAIAVSIDVTIFLLSLTVAQMQRRRAARGVILSVWAFVLALVLLSWYINYQYAQQFASPSMLSHTPTIRLAVIGNIDPLIASMFQVLALAYTWIADKIAEEEPEKTARDLEQEAEELARKLSAKQHIAALKDQQKGQRVKSLIATARDIKRELLPSTSEPPKGTPPEGQVEQPDEQHVEVSEVPPVEPAGSRRGTYPPSDPDTMTLISRSPTIAAWLSAGRRTATIKEVAKATGYSEKWIRNRIDKHLLKVHSRNRNLILIESLLAWLHSVQREEAKPGATEVLPTLELVREGTEQGTRRPA
jgi:hypothetical protein